MQIIPCQKSYSRRNIRIAVLATTIVLFVVVPPIVWLGLIIYKPLVAGITWLVPYVGGVTMLAVEIIILWLLWRILIAEIRGTAKDLGELKGYWRGLKGEQIVAQVLEDNFDESYCAYANVHIDEIGLNDDIDFLIVGPKGVIILEVKNWSRPALIMNGEWFAHLGSAFRRPRQNPIEQIKRYTDAVTHFFYKQNLQPPINRLIVKVGGDYIIPGAAVVYTISEDELVSRIKNFSQWPGYNPYIFSQIRHAVEDWAGPKCKL
jgi:hypothetical protein